MNTETIKETIRNGIRKARLEGLAICTRDLGGRDKLTCCAVGSLVLDENVHKWQKVSEILGITICDVTCIASGFDAGHTIKTDDNEFCEIGIQIRQEVLSGAL